MVVCLFVAVAGGGRAGRDHVHGEQSDSQKAPGLDVRPQGAAEDAGRPRRLLPRCVGLPVIWLLLNAQSEHFRCVGTERPRAQTSLQSSMRDFAVQGVSPAESRSTVLARLITLASFHPRCLAKSRVDGDWEWGGGSVGK